MFSHYFKVNLENLDEASLNKFKQVSCIVIHYDGNKVYCLGMLNDIVYKNDDVYFDVSIYDENKPMLKNLDSVANLYSFASVKKNTTGEDTTLGFDFNYAIITVD